MLVLVRHGQSTWNEKNLFTGWKDPDLTQRGIDEAISAGKKLHQQKIVFDIAFTSLLQRAEKTAHYILAELNQSNLKLIKAQELNERNYGDLSGLNKDDARKKWGKSQVFQWRRSYDVKPPGADGESLKDTKERVVPYYEKNIFPLLQQGQNILLSAHGNSLRALALEIENISIEKIHELEIKTGIPIIYEINNKGTIENKQII